MKKETTTHPSSTEEGAIGRESAFVLHHYQKGKLDTNKALRKVMGSPRPYWHRVAAAAAMLLVIVAAYGLYYHTHSETGKPQTTVTAEKDRKKGTTKTFHFDNTPINEALREIGDYYHVQLQASDTTRSITGDFETNSVDTLTYLMEQALGINIDTHKSRPGRN